MSGESWIINFLRHESLRARERNSHQEQLYSVSLFFTSPLRLKHVVLFSRSLQQFPLPLLLMQSEIGTPFDLY